MDAETDLRSIVAAILDAGPTAEEVGLPREIKELNRFRSGACRILEDDLVDPKSRAKLLSDLVATARGATLPDWAIATILDEIDLHADRQPQPRFSSRISAARALGRAGYTKCPTCRSDVLTELDVAHLENVEREWYAAESRHAGGTP